MSSTFRRDGWHLATGLKVRLGKSQPEHIESAHRQIVDVARTWAHVRVVPAVPKLDDQRGTALQARACIASGLVVVGDVLGEGAAQEQAAFWRDASGALRPPVGIVGARG